MHAAAVCALYRLRWQIEPAFKRLKSLMGLEDFDAMEPRLAKAAVCAKLILAILAESLLGRVLALFPTRDRPPSLLAPGPPAPPAADRRAPRRAGTRGHPWQPRPPAPRPGRATATTNTAARLPSAHYLSAYGVSDSFRKITLQAWLSSLSKEAQGSGADNAALRRVASRSASAPRWRRLRCTPVAAALDFRPLP